MNRLSLSPLRKDAATFGDTDRHLGRWLLLSVSVINLLAFSLGSTSLYNSYRQEMGQAEIRSRNLAEAVKMTIGSEVEKIDIVLSTVIDEVERNLRNGGIHYEQTNNFIQRELARVAEIQGLRVANREGKMFVGTGTTEGVLIDISERDYFIAHRDQSDLGLVISKPVIGRIDKQWTVLFSRRYNAPDGRFAGVVVASLTVSTLRSLLSRFEMGTKGLMTIRAMDDLSLVVRHPEILDGKRLETGSKFVSKELTELTRSGVLSATYHSVTPYDLTERIFSFSPLEKVPFFALAGLAADDYLAHWRMERNVTFLFMLAFVLVSSLSGRMLWLFFLRSRRDAERSRLLLRGASDGIYVLDSSGDLLEASDSFCSALGYTRGELVGMNVNQWDPKYSLNEIRLLASRELDPHSATTYESRHRRRDGNVIDVENTVQLFEMDGHEVFFNASRDITERKQAEEKIAHLAFFDQLTNLPNRTLLQDRLKQAMASSLRNGRYGALLLVDLDYFKSINDTLGHDVGDLLLKQVAQRLTECVRAEDTVARLGGDEFVVMLVNLSESQSEAASLVELIAGKINAALNHTFEFKDASYLITPSIGASAFLGQQTDIDTLLKQADLAMYKAKEAGRNTLRFFDPEMARDVLERALLDNDLRTALQKQQFVLHYQAQVTDSQVTGVEALLRWQHPERGLVFPGNFIAAIEETGLILPVGQWVLETACKQLADWGARPEMSHLTVAVNISARQINHEGFVEQVLMALDRSNANPQRLKLELTESLLVNNVEDTIGKMTALKAKGVGFSMDDFGTGYSSLSYLKRLPLDQLKIDQSFVRDILADPNDAAIAKMIVVLAESLGLVVIAEGVETEAQRDSLAQHGCYAYQGYLFSRPLPLDEFELFIKQGKASGVKREA